MLGANHIPPTLSDRVIGSWLVSDPAAKSNFRVSLVPRTPVGPTVLDWVPWKHTLSEKLQKVYWGVLLGDTSERNKKERIGQRMKLIHNAIFTEASVDSTESSRTRMAHETSQKLRQCGQAFVPAHLQLLARGQWGRVISLGEAFPGDRHICDLLTTNIPSSSVHWPWKRDLSREPLYPLQTVKSFYLISAIPQSHYPQR